MSYPLEHSLEATDLDNLFKHFKDWDPIEGCGLLLVRKGKEYWLPCTNLSETPDNFIIDPKIYTLASRAYDISAVVHSHVHASPLPSEQDRAVCNALNIPFIIYSFPTMEKYTLLPEKMDKPLIGRTYKFGESDCFEAARDCYRHKLNIILPTRIEFIDDWWEEGFDYFSEPFLNDWGFKKVESSTLKRGDLLVFSVYNSTANHCGVYLGEDIFFHHAVDRLSCRENLYPFWKKFLTGIYRYET